MMKIKYFCRFIFKSGSFSAFGWVAHKGTLIILILLFGYFLIITSKCWWPIENPVTRSITIRHPQPKAGNTGGGVPLESALKNGAISSSSSSQPLQKPKADSLALSPSGGENIVKHLNDLKARTSFIKSPSGPPMGGEEGPDLKVSAKTYPFPTITDQRIVLSKENILNRIASKKVRVIKLEKYKDCFLIFSGDLNKMEEIASSFPKEVRVMRKTGLDPRLFHWNTSKSRKEIITSRYELRFLEEVIYLSVMYNRGKVDHIDGGYYWIPVFGKFGTPKAFPNFQIRPNGQLFSPTNETKFLWQDAVAEFQECNYSRVKKFYDTHGEEIATAGTVQAFMRSTVHLRKLLSSWDMYNWICSGSLLGWYRQCAAIPYTSDADTASWAYQYKEWMKEYFLGKDKELHLWRKYGRANDSLEFTLKAKDCRIDLFFMYEGVNPPKNNVVPSGKNQRYNWMGVQTFDNYKKGKEIFPVIDRLCSADLHGYLVNIPCSPLKMIQAEYGPDKWFEPMKNFNWISSPNNVVIDGKWSPEDWDGGAVYEKH